MTLPIARQQEATKTAALNLRSQTFRTLFLAAALVVAAGGAIFIQTGGFSFLDYDDPEGTIMSTGVLDGTGNPSFTDVSGSGVDMGVTLVGQDPDGDLTDGGTAPTDRDELTSPPKCPISGCAGHSFSSLRANVPERWGVPVAAKS